MGQAARPRLCTSGRVGSNVFFHLRSHEVGCRCGEAEQRECAE